MRIKEVKLDDPKDKVVYVVWHPESWEAPHMVHAYNDKRFYRRGNFRAVSMEEHEVERLYLRRQSRHEIVVKFFQQGNFGESFFERLHTLMRIVICPYLAIENRVSFSSDKMRSWLKNNIYSSGSGWIPFLQGVRHTNVSIDGIGRTIEARMFRNGAVSLCRDLEIRNGSSTESYPLTLQHPKIYDFMCWTSKFYNEINLTGPVVVSVRIANAKGTKPSASQREIPLLPDSEFVWRENELSFQESIAATELRKDAHAVVDKLQNRFLQAFGIW